MPVARWPAWSSPRSRPSSSSRPRDGRGSAGRSSRRGSTSSASAAARTSSSAWSPRTRPVTPSSGHRLLVPLDALGPGPRSRRRRRGARLAGVDGGPRDRSRPGDPGVGRAVQRGIRGPRNAAAARRGPDGGRQGRGTVRGRGPPAARVGFGRAPRVLRHGAQTSRGRQRRVAGRGLDHRRATGGAGARLRPPAALGIGHLREVGASTVTLSVNGRNPRALGLYEAEGFHRTATRERWARPA